MSSRKLWTVALPEDSLLILLWYFDGLPESVKLKNDSFERISPKNFSISGPIRGSLNKFPDFFVWALLLIVHAWNSSPLRTNLFRLQCTYCTVPTTSGRPHGSPLVWVCQWSLSQPLSSSQLSHNDSLWA